ncbi:MAG: pseudouridine synthase [Mageeibacillus sp.]|jgi:23S rRNA pseudouridine2604 synthase|nr:pseudouridine synthase [Mageeibacillus sp.]MCI1263397.1 pseudouridine synthase [Saccharofermentans sp.]MCI1769066.1 pseudouridine synthase [Mageeibacillus sp.]MCI2044120.1 pseudouridine synthase [Mageeibacillus sp.]
MSGNNEEVRINKYIASSGLCSRREADRLIEEGKVTINGVTAEPGAKVMSSDTVSVMGKTVIPEESMLYIALNKPLGITCTTDTRDPSNIIDFLGFDERIFPIGRLDKNSSGLILLTNDGSVVNKLLRAENGHEKEYKVTVDKPIDGGFVKAMEGGVPVLDQITLPCRVIPESTRTFRIVLHQGLNRQIRRMCEYLGYRVIRLKRIRFMNIDLGKLEPGEWRKLDRREITELLNN